MYKIKSDNPKEKWKRVIEDYNYEWINSCFDILESYIERCEGSNLEIKESSIVWQFMIVLKNSKNFLPKY